MPGANDGDPSGQDPINVILACESGIRLGRPGGKRHLQTGKALIARGIDC
jgi:hypothetical protein